ncbi:MAG TPA: PilZ domain-containing protein [Gemmataceae bacterium]|nr:PilZ domain-containing protein [Gemmataceae bacterium]
MFGRTRSLIRKMTGSGTPEDRRVHARFPADVEAICRPVADDTPITARVRNVSRTGINLLAPRAVREGTMLRIAIPTLTRPTTLLACVMHVSPEGQAGWSLGCMFSLELSDEEMRQFGGQKQVAGPDDQRAWVRYPARGTVEYRVLPGDGSPPVTAELIDLSPAGVGLLLNREVDAGTALTVSLKRKDGKPDRTVIACIVYLASRSDGEWAAGCHFMHELGEAEMRELLWRKA